jgi:hypothetical protein
MKHLTSGMASEKQPLAEAVRRVLREQAFTFLNRFAALRMAEERGFLQECVGQGLQSKGFQVFETVARSGLGGAYERYVTFLHGMFDELSLDLGVLFDRWSPFGLLFPREPALLKFFDLLNDPELKPLWKEDETIGWIYQYFNDEAERKKLREESAAPRNSRELAVRNQFFTPRYVVEFLTDNTLGRIWYEMTKGQTNLKDQCRYLVRRPNEYFLHDSAKCFTNVRPDLLSKGLADLPEDLTWEEIQTVALCLDDLPSKLCRELGLGECHEFGERKRREFESSRKCEGTFFELFCWLYFEQRDAKWSGQGDKHPERRENRVKAIYQAIRVKLSEETANLSQEDLLKQPVFIPHRPIKDPRTILMLDPACGSMHFGLYAFDLFEVIYEKYWDMLAAGQIPDHALRITHHGLKPLTELYPDKQAFLRDVPRLIIEHNLHGIDIDPRCAQIAGLSLWLRAQKAWQRLGLKPAERPAIKRSNIVCAEPMPGEKELLREFVEREFPAEERGIFLRLLTEIFTKMQLAGEAGSLLKIEEEIRSGITEAKKLWKEGPQLEQSKLFAELEPAKQRELTIDLTGITDEQFWASAESRIYDALRDYAERAENGGGFQRRLFAEDAARGFAFIDVCRKRYDVAVMNPPFGEPSIVSRKYLYSTFESAKTDVFSAFIDRGIQIANAVGAITSRTCFFLAGFQDWRRSLTDGEKRISALADLADGVLDAMVETAAYTILGNAQKECAFFRVTETQNKADQLLDICQAWGKGIQAQNLFVGQFDTFDLIPTSPFAYYLSVAEAKLFGSLAGLECEWGDVIRGPEVPDLLRGARCWWEVSPQRIGKALRWVWYAKGGEFKRFAHDVHLVADYEGALKGSCPFRRPGGDQYYFKSGITYTQRTTKPISFRILPGGCLTSPKGPAIIPKNAGSSLALLGLVNTKLFSSLINSRVGAAGAAARSYDLDILRRIPLPHSNEHLNRAIKEYTQLALSFGQRENQIDESNPDFVSMVLNYSQPKTLSQLWETAESSLRESQEIYDRARAEIEKAVLRACEIKEPGDKSSSHELVFQKTSPKELTGIVISYSLGCAFGRWDIRYATGEKAAPELPDPFAPLPVCPPGQLQNAQGLPVERAESGKRKAEKYPIEIPWDGILVDDPNHPLDIERRVREVIEIIWGANGKSTPHPGPLSGRGGEGGDRRATPESIEHEACEILGVKSLRDYFRKPAGFFADHLKRYSKSRRQAPIYWPLSTASSSYTLWIYYHRLTDQTLFQCVNDFVKPKLEEVNRDLERLQRSEAKDQRSAREELEQLQDFAIELKEFQDELLRVAGLPYKPDLNDGVLITASPLWKLFRLPKWQKDLKACLESLEAGEYDWAHLAYTIWPDRVKKVCKTDRSIAIAHGLEDLCEVKAPEKKTNKKKKEQLELDEG